MAKPSDPQSEQREARKRQCRTCEGKGFLTHRETGDTFTCWKCMGRRYESLSKVAGMKVEGER